MSSKETSEGRSKLPATCSGEEWCPMTTAASLISKKWNPVIIERLLENGSMGFNDLKKDLSGISSKVLSDSLEDLQRACVVNREVVSKKPYRVDYSLTERGKELEGAVRELREWGEKNFREPEEDEEPVA